MKFIIYGGGDSDVGIPQSEMEVTFEGNEVWDENLIERTKNLLKEFDDNGANISTESEYDEMIDNEQKFQKESLMNGIRRKYIESNENDFLKFIEEEIKNNGR